MVSLRLLSLPKVQFGLLAPHSTYLFTEGLITLFSSTWDQRRYAFQDPHTHTQSTLTHSLASFSRLLRWEAEQRASARAPSSFRALKNRINVLIYILPGVKSKCLHDAYLPSSTHVHWDTCLLACHFSDGSPPCHVCRYSLPALVPLLVGASSLPRT